MIFLIYSKVHKFEIKQATKPVIDMKRTFKTENVFSQNGKIITKRITIIQ